MAEKRRLSARERREPAAKRRVSEAASQASASSQAQQSSKKKASTPVVAPSPALTTQPTPEIVEPPLPTKIKDGEALPILPLPQPADLSPKEYQSITESAVLLAALERSKKKWLSDGILERYWTKPKKTKREQIEGKNPPKETMSKVGPCNIVVGPHLFDAMLYTVKDPNAPPPVQYTPPQRPMVHYGHPNNFQQYHPYPHPSNSAQNARPHPSHATPATPSPSQQGTSKAVARHLHNPVEPLTIKLLIVHLGLNQHNGLIQMLATRAAQDPELKALMRLVASTNATQEQLRTFQAHIDELNAIIRAREQQQRRQQQSSQPPTPNSAPQPPQTPQPTAQIQQQHPQPQSQKPQSQTQPPSQPLQPPVQESPLQQPHPKPQIVISTPRPQPQRPAQKLPRVEVQISKQPQPTTSTPQSSNDSSAKSHSFSTQPPTTTPQIKQEPGTDTANHTAPLSQISTPSAGPSPAPVTDSHANPKQQSSAVQTVPPPQQQQQAGQRQGPQYPPYQQPAYQSQAPAIQSRPPQYGSPAPYYRATPPRPPPPPRLNYKSVVFEFTSPLTPYGSSTSGHAGSGDRYLFPENSILEWLPGGTTVLASFLLVRKVDPNTPFPIEMAPEAANSRVKGKSASRSKKGDKGKAKTEGGQPEKDQVKDGGTNGKAAEGHPESSSRKDAPTSNSKEAGPKEEKEAEGKGDQKLQPATVTKPAVENPKGKEKVDEKKDDSNLKEYYQLVTFRIYSTNPKVLEPLGRVVNPPDEVRKYMNEIMDRAERAPEGFLAYQLPRELPAEVSDLENDKKGGTPVPGLNAGARSKLSRGRTIGADSDAENTQAHIDEEEEGGEEEVEEEEEEVEEEELRDFYGPPTALPPIGV
ncbi:hypothetical protein ARAM_006707 [Aspergillus rambellii]|uniref:SWR1-complex protein 3 domain-containing protein n=1 Tax=Aspergillus rambellii TaxID=308745 RepID=A0A0F8XP19_9EURO|nr:hypothetical protein ARAM_006707 [Aspergillus rambellii]